MRKRDLFATLLATTRLLETSRRSRPRRLSLMILAYHRVCPHDPSSYALDDELVSATPEAFGAQMRWVKANYDVLSFADLARALAAENLPARPLVVTFDDGYRDVHDVALPILESHGLPATVFLTTGSMGTREPFWFDRIAGWIKKTPSVRLKLRDSTVREFTIDGNRRGVVHAVQELLKFVDEHTHADLMRQLELQVGVELDRLDHSWPLSWDEVRHMSTRGIEFGSHTVKHLNLARLSADRLAAELRDSKARIEKETGVPVIALAYPFGTRGTYSDEVRDAARCAGYTFAVTYGGAVNDLARMDRFALQRVAVERDMGLDVFRAGLRYPRLLGPR